MVGLLTCMMLAFVAFPGAAKASLIRVLVLESSNCRIRGEDAHPLLVAGIDNSVQTISALNLYLDEGNYQIAFDGLSNELITLPNDGSQIIIKSTDPRGIWIGKRRYKGELRIHLLPNNLKIVNYVDLENYLSSVVGSEMPESWPMAALQAQAIASRTYAIQQIGKNPIYDILSNQNSQVYLGIESETDSTIRAVKTTKSLVITYQGDLINAVFHSSSGGRTEDSGNVWKYQLPYLVSVADYDQHNPMYEWGISFDNLQLKNAFPEIGGLYSIEVLSKSNAGRVLNARFYGPNGSIDLLGREIRERLKLRSTLIDLDVLASSSLERELINGQEHNNINLRESWSLDSLYAELDSNQVPSYSFAPGPLPELQLDNSAVRGYQSPQPLPPIPTNFVLEVNGQGSGHGVGMSQWGAYGLAMEGADYREIIHHYYKNVQITQNSFL